MDDLISRKAAIDALDTIESEVADGEGFRYAKWREYFENLPSAQPEIIHCKDCKWKQGAECVRFAEIRPFSDDFCSRGERRAYG